MNAWRSRIGVAIAAGLIGGPALAADDNRIVVGQTVALTGSISEHGQAVAAGARAYIEGVNAAGGVGGRRIALVTLDDGGDATRAAENTRRLIERDGVVAMFGGVEGGPCVASLKEASDRGVPLIACMAGSPEMREPFNRYSFPVRAPHLAEFGRLLDIAKTYGYGKVAFLHADSDTVCKHLANVQRLAVARKVEVIPVVVKSGAKAEDLAEAIMAEAGRGVQPRLVRDLQCDDPRSPAQGRPDPVQGFEPTTPWFVARYSIQLSYGREAANSTRARLRAPASRPDPRAARRRCGCSRRSAAP